MNKVLGQFILVVILLVSVSNAFESADCTGPRGNEHSDGIFSSQMQQNYQKDFLSLLPSPANGDSFNGSTFGAITAALPNSWSVAVEIKNKGKNVRRWNS
ncbi:unnamed protein product [Allacma fusca]|uniref:Secreted protein n=1 Tax=Allacma fusca TaxID=39272 RepID=A0A8J2PBV6_9HEXA|nr:unnamed protein product [Allacma fusca]